MKTYTLLLTIIINALLVTACAPSLKGDVYSRSDSQQTLQVKWATVESTKPVVIEGDRTIVGQASGAVIGGAAGRSTTESRTRGLATAAGAVAGAIAGQAIEEKMTRAQGLELTLQLDSGDTIVIVQEVERIDEFQTGDRVKIIAGKGKMRVSK